MKIKVILLWLIIIIIVISGCATKEETKSSEETSDLALYENEELGISFKYPSAYKVYQADKDSLRVDSGYENPENSMREISIGIRKINEQRPTEDQIKFRLQEQPIISRQTKENYELMKFGQGSQYYIISDKGLFYVGDTLDTFGWKSRFEEEGIYREYRARLDEIRNSIKII